MRTSAEGADTEEQPGGDDSATVSQIRASSLLTFGRFLALLITTATQVVIVRFLTKADFGAFAYALSIATVVRTLASVGENQSLSRFLSIYEEDGSRDKVFGTLAMVAVKTTAIGAVVIAGLFALEGWLRTDLVADEAAVDLVLILSFLGPVEALDRAVEGVFAVFSRPRAIFFRKYVLAPSLRLAAVLVLVTTSSDVEFLATGYVLAGVAGLVLYAAMLYPTLRRRWTASGGLSRLSMPIREYFGFSLPLVTNEIFYLSLSTVGVILLGKLEGAEAVASFRAVLPAARLNQVVMFSFTMLFTPLAARLFVRQDRAQMKDAYWRTAAWLTIFSFPVFALTGPLAEPTTTTLFGARYAESAPYLAVLSLGFYFNAALGFNALTLQTFGRVRYVAVSNLVASAVNIVLSLALIPWLGALGAALANAISLATLNVVNQVRLRSAVGVGVFDRSYVPMYAIVVLAALVLWAVQAAVRPAAPAAVGLAAVASVVVFALNRKVLRVGDTFPELARVPVIGRFIS